MPVRTFSEITPSRGLDYTIGQSGTLLSASLWSTASAAQSAADLIDQNRCSSACHGSHEVIQLIWRNC